MLNENEVIQLRNSLNKEGICVTKNIFGNELVSFLKTCSSFLDISSNFLPETNKEGVVKSSNNTFSKFSYSTIIGESLLLYLTPYYNKISGKNLVPTYSYYRTYFKGQNLIPHKDRPSCQYSISLQIKSSNNKSWPIYFHSKTSQIVEAIVEIGDVVFYKGEEVLHWRNHLEFENSSHFFLHWVDKDNPTYKKYWYDGRKRLGIPK